MPASCRAGMYVTPCFDAIHVVPQKKHTSESANNAFALRLAMLVEYGLTVNV